MLTGLTSAAGGLPTGTASPPASIVCAASGPALAGTVAGRPTREAATVAPAWTAAGGVGGTVLTRMIRLRLESVITDGLPTLLSWMTVSRTLDEEASRETFSVQLGLLNVVLRATSPEGPAPTMLF